MFAPLLIAAALVGKPQAPADGPGPRPTKVKDFVVEWTGNEQSGFMIRVAVDKPDRVYTEGEPMTVSIVPERDCYVYLIYYNAEDRISCLFPNEFQQENFLKAKAEYQVPAPGDPFRFRAGAPFGTELLQVVATLQPIDLFQGKRLTASRVTPLTFGDIRKAFEVVRKGQDEAVWAEARIPIITRPGMPSGPDQGQAPPAQKPGKRLGVCIGISEYQDQRVPRLRVCHLDAERMAKALQEKCAVPSPVVLTNDRATLEAIRQAIFVDLVRDSKPGDTVFLYFSGHGGRTADTNGDEADGLDEYLVPYDGELGKPQTMLVDDTFARWMQELDGRKVCILLDNCYSGGSSKAIKGLGVPAPPRALKRVDFFDGEIRRAKDLGQTGTEVLAASKADQIAWVMPTGDGSVLTYYVLRALDDSKTDANRDGKITVSEVYNTVKDAVTGYVQQTFQADQQPQFIDNAHDQILLRP